MFTAALLITAKNWKEPKCPSTDKWINQMVYINTMDYYSAIKMNGVLKNAIYSKDELCKHYDK